MSAAKKVIIAIIVIFVILIASFLVLQIAQQIAARNLQPQAAPEPVLGFPTTTSQGQGILGLGLLTSSFTITSITLLNGIGINLYQEFNNPDTITATIDQFSYNVYIDGNFFGSGQTSTAYNIAAQSSQTVTFPLQIPWGATRLAVRNDILNGGQITVEIKGTYNIVVSSLTFPTPFDITLTCSGMQCNNS